MRRNLHVHIGMALKIVLAGSALLLAAASAGLAADGAGAFRPDQAIVFDGSTSATDVFAVALTNDGYFVELSEFGFVCPETDHVSPGGLFALIGNSGVFTLAREIGHTLLLPVPSPAGELPDALDDLETDCDLLEALPALQAYLISVDSQSQALLLQTQDCRNRVRNFYCQVVAAVEDAETLAPAGIPSSFGGGAGPGKADFTDPEECPGIAHLAEIPAVLDYLASLAGHCEGREAMLVSLLAQVIETVQSAGGLTPIEKDNFLAQADANLGEAEQNLLDAQAMVVDLDDVTASLTEASLEASCADCGEPGLFSGTPLSGAVQLLLHRQALGRFMGAFQSAANHTDDPELAARLSDLAGRLAAVPNDRVLQVIFPSVSAVGQDLVALRASALPDDGVSPLVVILTGLESGAPVPAPNAADIELLFENVRRFNDSLSREPRVD